MRNRYWRKCRGFQSLHGAEIPRRTNIRVRARARGIFTIIDEYKSRFTGLICVLTGGDSELLAKRLKNSIFAHQNLVLNGLNDILNFNLE